MVGYVIPFFRWPWSSFRRTPVSPWRSPVLPRALTKAAGTRALPQSSLYFPPPASSSRHGRVRCKIVSSCSTCGFDSRVFRAASRSSVFQIPSMFQFLLFPLTILLVLRAKEKKESVIGRYVRLVFTKRSYLQEAGST